MGGLLGQRPKVSSTQIDDPQAARAQDVPSESRAGGPSLLDRWITVERATPEQVWERLTDMTVGPIQMDGTWKDKMRRFDGGGFLGEVRSPEDWSRAPLGVSLYVVATKHDESICIRWASDSDEAKVALAGRSRNLNHSHLHRGDVTGTARKGFVTRSEAIRVDK
jgi:hypothetical protein